MKLYYKFTTYKMFPPIADSKYRYRLGVWTRKEIPILCDSGWHVCKPDHAIEYINERCFLVEGRGAKEEGDDKIAFAQIRFVKEVKTWNEKTQRLFACWCAKRALKLIKKPDPRSIKAVKVAERFAKGLATRDELAAAKSAADAVWLTYNFAARSAGDAAMSAAMSADSSAADAVSSAVSSAARSAASSAARFATDTASYSAQYAERKAQNKKLLAILKG